MRRTAVWAVAAVTAALAMVAVAPPAAHAEPMCAGDMTASAFVGTYRLTMMTAGGQYVYSSTLVLGANLAATEFGTVLDPLTGQWVTTTAYGEFRSQYLTGSTCTAFFYTRLPQSGVYVNCYGGSAPYTNGVRVTRFDGACRLNSASGTLTRTFIAERS